MSKHKETTVIEKLRRMGVKFGREGKEIVADARSLKAVGIAVLGKLDYLMNTCGYRVHLPAQPKGRGLAHP